MRIFVAPSALRAGELSVSGDEHHYLGRVRRARVGDSVELVDGEGRRASASIVRMTDGETTLSVGAPEEILATPPHITVLLPLIKGDRMDVALEKLVEVGVDSILVWPAQRCVVKLEPDRRASRMAKYEAALAAAARQSGRAALPTVGWCDSLVLAISSAANAETRLVLDPTSDTPLERALTLGDRVAFVSGPEGGLAPSEIEELTLAGFVAVGLGPRVLRAETAPVAAVAIVRALTHS
ncbi:16S rRNA (uracil(1498)-N(3))-methyltransferase [soil metagenome]